MQTTGEFSCVGFIKKVSLPKCQRRRLFQNMLIHEKFAAISSLVLSVWGTGAAMIMKVTEL